MNWPWVARFAPNLRLTELLALKNVRVGCDYGLPLIFDPYVWSSLPVAEFDNDAVP